MVRVVSFEDGSSFRVPDREQMRADMAALAELSDEEILARFEARGIVAPPIAVIRERLDRALDDD